jgi:hypothetical protein
VLRAGPWAKLSKKLFNTCKQKPYAAPAVILPCSMIRICATFFCSFKRPIFRSSFTTDNKTVAQALTRWVMAIYIALGLTFNITLRCICLFCDRRKLTTATCTQLTCVWKNNAASLQARIVPYNKALWLAFNPATFCVRFRSHWCGLATAAFAQLNFWHNSMIAHVCKSVRIKMGPVGRPALLITGRWVAAQRLPAPCICTRWQRSVMGRCRAPQI